MGTDGKWKLSPAYDVIYSHNPSGQWTNEHQMTANGKRDGFTKEDLVIIGESISLSRPEEIINEVVAAVNRWAEYAKEAGVNQKIISEIGKQHRTHL